MKNTYSKIFEFNGKLSSLRYLCDKYGIDLFCLITGFKFNRIKELYNSNLDGNHFVEDVLISDNYQEELYKLYYKNQISYKKYDKLISDLDYSIKNYCNIGLEKAKILLNKLSEEDFIAKSLKLALEIEEFNINAKKLMMNSFYQQKEQLILELIELSENNNINYGLGDSDILGIPSIIYFDLKCGQVSWHTMLDKNYYKCYDGVWDGLEYSTLGKIENYIKEKYL